MKTLLLLSVLLLSLSSSLGATYGQKMVAGVLLAEAGIDGIKGMTAVAEVIRHRADSQKVSPLTIVKQKYQFSSVNGTTVDKIHEKMRASSHYEEALKIARMMYNTPEELPGYANGATHFVRFDCHPSWAKNKKPVAKVGHHWFYKL